MTAVQGLATGYSNCGLPSSPAIQFAQVLVTLSPEVPLAGWNHAPDFRTSPSSPGACGGIGPGASFNIAEVNSILPCSWDGLVHPNISYSVTPKAHRSLQALAGCSRSCFRRNEGPALFSLLQLPGLKKLAGMAVSAERSPPQ
jgi:hypothetical protein